MTKVLVIGLDGATFDVIRPLVQANRLPNLARLMETGVFGHLQSTIQPSSEQAWASFMTGKNNGKHGTFSFVKRRPGTYRFELIDGRARAGRSLWRILSDRGLRSIVINVPLTYPPESINGVIVGGLFSPGTSSRFTYPSPVYDSIIQETERYIIDIETPRDPVEADELPAFTRTFVNRLKDMVALRTLATCHLMAQQPWNLCMVVYTALDRAQHKLWRFMDSAHPTYDPALGEQHGRLIPDLYAFIDEQMGQLLDQVKEDTTVFVVSDHGFGPLHKVVYINKWLAQLGYLVPRERGPLGAILQSAWSHSLGLAYRIAKRVVPPAAARRLATRLMSGAGADIFSALAFSDVEWSRTRAYCIGGSNIYLNLRGREPDGIIDRDSAEYEQTIYQIISDLRELTDPETGEPVVGDIYLGRELYEGPFADDGPDITFLYRDCRYRGIVFDLNRRDDAVIGQSQDFIGDVSGTHTLHGILIANGKPIARYPNYGGAHIMDMAPTILYQMEQAIPDDMDGKVLTGIFTPAYAQEHPIEHEMAREEKDKSTDGTDYSDEDQRDIEQRLRGLGYLD